MFAIRVLPPAEPDGEGRGEIVVGDFTEHFACHPVGESLIGMERRWRDELARLVAGTAAVALIHDPRFAWIVYREGERCDIQQVLALDGDFEQHLRFHCTVSDEGLPVSEWHTDVAAIARFLEGDARHVR